MESGQGPLFYGAGGNGARAYRCSFCNSVITYSDRLIAVSDSERHTFANPVGVKSEFYTFSSCPGAAAFGPPTEEYVWFPGYSWCLAVCQYCSTHLGWYYQSVLEPKELPEFWGILIRQVLVHHG